MSGFEKACSPVGDGAVFYRAIPAHFRRDVPGLFISACSDVVTRSDVASLNSTVMVELGAGLEPMRGCDLGGHIKAQDCCAERRRTHLALAPDALEQEAQMLRRLQLRCKETTWAQELAKGGEVQPDIRPHGSASLIQVQDDHVRCTLDTVQALLVPVGARYSPLRFGFTTGDHDVVLLTDGDVHTYGYSWHLGWGGEFDSASPRATVNTYLEAGLTLQALLITPAQPAQPATLDQPATPAEPATMILRYAPAEEVAAVAAAVGGGDACTLEELVARGRPFTDHFTVERGMLLVKRGRATGPGVGAPLWQLVNAAFAAGRAGAKLSIWAPNPQQPPQLHQQGQQHVLLQRRHLRAAHIAQNLNQGNRFDISSGRVGPAVGGAAASSSLPKLFAELGVPRLVVWEQGPPEPARPDVLSDPIVHVVFGINTS